MTTAMFTVVFVPAPGQVGKETKTSIKERTMQIETTVQMKRGGSIPCIASAKVYDSDDYPVIDDLQIFWLKTHKGKLYPIKESLIANTEKAEEDLSVAFHSQDRDYFCPNC